jgi:hypothetical protein
VPGRRECCAALYIPELSKERTAQFIVSDEAGGREWQHCAPV